MEVKVYEITYRKEPHIMMALHDDGSVELLGQGFNPTLIVEQVEPSKVIIKKIQ